MDQTTADHHEYWDSFYASRASNAVPAAPSAFAEWTEQRLAAEQTLVEFGFGNARDSLWFARQGHAVVGYDFAQTAVHQAQGRADAEDLGASFNTLDLYDAAAVTDAGASIAARDTQPVIYGRFLIHSLEDAGRHHLFDLAAQALRAGGELYLEFRTGQDQGEEHVFGEDHFRVYLDPALVEQEIVDRGGKVTHNEAGYGLAVYKTEDPHVARLVASWAG